MILKITLTYILMLALAGLAYALTEKHFTCRGQTIIEKVFAVAVAVLAVGICVEIMILIWSLE